MPVRTELGTRTIFNILGPMTNPAGVKIQLTGAFDQVVRTNGSNFIVIRN